MGWFEIWLLGFAITWLVMIFQASKHEVGAPVVAFMAVIWPITVPFALFLWLLGGDDDGP